MSLRVCLSRVYKDVFLNKRTSANQKELVTDLIIKAKQIEYLINSLPEPEPEEVQVS